MRNLFLKIFTISFGTILLSACNSSNTRDASTNPDSLGSDKPASMDTTVGMATTSTTGVEQNFVNYLVVQNANEIASLNAAIAKGLPKKIKEQAVVMLKDHNRLDEDIKYLLSMKSKLKMPAADSAGKIIFADSTDWAKTWVYNMMQKNNEMLDSLGKAKIAIADADLNRIIVRTIPVVNSHLTTLKRTMAGFKK